MKVVKPTLRQKTDANLAKSKAFAKLLREKDVLLRSELIKAAQDRGLWDDEKQKELDDVRQKILDGTAQLNRGGRTLEGKEFSRQQAKELAIEMMDLRARFLSLNSVLSEFEKFTCEAQSEEAEYDYICSVCILNDDDTKVFTSLEDFQNRREEPEIQEMVLELDNLVSDYDPNWYNELPEVNFLLKYKFINDEYQLINEDGKRVNEDGKLVNEEGQLVNEQNELINEYGEKVDSEGKLVEFVEFVD